MSAAAARVVEPAEVDIQPFLNGREHLLAQSERLRLMLHGEVLRMRAAGLLNENQFRGLYVSDEQIDTILYAPPRGPAGQYGASAGLPEMEALAMRAAKLQQQIAAQCAASGEAGVVLPLLRLQHLYSLSNLERDALLLSIAPELDERFEALYSYAQNDVTRKRPTVGLILRLLGRTVAERLSLRVLFSATGRLLQIPLVRFSDDVQAREAPLLSRPVRPEERIIDFLLEHACIDSRLRLFTTTIEPDRKLASLHFPEPLAQGLRQAQCALREEGGILFFHGAAGTGKRAAAEAISAQAGRGLVIADACQATSSSVPVTLALLRREARLRGANLLLTHAETWLAQEGAQRQSLGPIHQSFAESVADAGLILFVAAQSPWPVEGAWPCAWATFEFPVPGFLHRTRLWQDAMESVGIVPQPETAAVLANQFVLTGGQIGRACRMAVAHAEMRGQDAASLTSSDFAAAARAQSNQGLQRRAQKVNSAHHWPDLVLPPRTVQQLREVCAAERYRSVIYSEWGFDRRLMYGKGLNVLFCGPSGTGKTMAAGIVARELSLDLYKIDLSSVISKYIGETEKQLSQIFSEAQSSNAILFFDEADAIFGKRSEVKDAHDRYANVEVAYLLQKMEEYEGIVILATNFRKNIDEAFTRRIHYIVDFPFPEAQYRERIWRSLIPARRAGR